jgi:hypothetical protein
MIRFAAAAAVALLVTASAARADAPPAATVPSAAPAWLLQYTTVAVGGRIRITRYVSAHADGTVTWQQLDVNTGIADTGPMHRCTGGATLLGDELRAIEDAARALKEPRRDANAAPATGSRGGVAVALIVPRGAGVGVGADVSSLNFDPEASGSDPRLKRAAAILSRYRCPR